MLGYIYSQLQGKMNNTQGKFFVFEGIDGSGKSTQVKLLAERLEAQGRKVYTTCEPTDGAIGTFIRQILRGGEKASEKTIAALFLADRLDHLENELNGLRKKVDEGYIVICDRYYFSSYAYHSAHVPLSWVIEANSICADILKPTLNIFLDISPKKSLKRIQAGREDFELFENEERLTTTRTQYFNAFERLKEQENIAVISADDKIETIADNVMNEVSKYL